MTVESSARPGRARASRTRRGRRDAPPGLQPSRLASGEAFGWPGLEPRWQTARKVAVGTAREATSRVWFTLAGGIVTEVYYPRLDVASTRDLQLLVTDGTTFFHEERRDLEHRVERVDEAAPAFRVTSRDPQDRYGLEKLVFTDPRADALVVQVRLEAVAPDLAVYVLWNPHLKNLGWGNHARVAEVAGRPVLTAWREDVAAALVCSAPVMEASAGFVGFSDGWQDLQSDFRLDWRFATASGGNVALTARIEPDGGAFTLVLGFGPDPERAAAAAAETLARPAEDVLRRYVAGWRAYQEGLDDLSQTASDGGRLYRSSLQVLASHEDKTHPGAFIASLSVPWGETTPAVESGGYHLVWPRDLYHVATALLAAGDRQAPRRALRWLAAHQRPDGSWSQNSWVSGEAYSTGLQLDEVAYPVLLAWRLWREGALEGFDPWPMVRAAGLHLARSGPVTPQERWEENSGYSPSTLAVGISALLAAAHLAEARAEADVAGYLHTVAGYWLGRVEAWTYTRCGSLLPGRREHYERIASILPGDLEPAGTECRVLVPLRNVLAEAPAPSQCCVVDAGFLELVRYGLRRPRDRHVVASLPVIDALLRVDTPCGPAWRRYNRDGYGEKDDGSAYDGTGVGRAWPLLTGERGHYVLAAGRDPGRYLRAMECFANEGGMLPEQVWDAAPVPARDLHPGRGTGSATPLAWAHAEYVKLLRSTRDGRPFDLPDGLPGLEGVPEVVIWKLNHKVRAIRATDPLRVEVYAPAEIRWTRDDWVNVAQESLVEVVPGVWVRDFPGGSFSPGRSLQFTLRWTDEGRWESRDFAVALT